MIIITFWRDSVRTSYKEQYRGLGSLVRGLPSTISRYNPFTDKFMFIEIDEFWVSLVERHQSFIDFVLEDHVLNHNNIYRAAPG